MILHAQELTRLRTEAMCAIEARNFSNVTFVDCSGGSFGAIMGMMECELSRVHGDAEDLRNGDARDENERS